MTTSTEVRRAVERVLHQGSAHVGTELVARIVASDVGREGHEATVRENGNGFLVVLGPTTDDAA